MKDTKKYEETEYKPYVNYLKKVIADEGMKYSEEDIYVGYTPLFHAVVLNDFELIKSYIENGIDANLFYPINLSERGNILHFISSYEKQTIENIKIAELLIKHGININAKNSKNMTALGIAASAQNDNCLELIELLLNHGADIDERISNDNSTALIKSITNESYKIADLLIEAGADINLRTEYGWTACRMAFARKQKELGEKLISKGANLRPYVGIGGIPSEEGGIIVQVLDNTTSGSAKEAGIKENDIIKLVDGIRVNNIPELINIIGKHRPLDEIPFTLKRETEILEIIVEIQVI